MKFLNLIKESKRHATTLLFIGGFIFDLIILPEAGHTLTIVIGFVYLSIVAIALALREWVIARNRATKGEARLFSFLTFAIAYFSGSALSFVCVYAIRSATLSVSWPLFILLFVCVLVNEVVSSHQFRFTLDVAVFLIALLFFTIFNVPVLVNIQNDATFLASVIVTIVLSLLYIRLLQSTSESAHEETPRLYALAVGIPMFIGMLYFLNIIPAVPLSLASSGVYHMVTKNEEGGYTTTKELDTRVGHSLRIPVYHLGVSDTGVYFFSSVSAPALLTAPLSHVWEYYDPSKKRWVPMTTIPFTLDGGREDGYRAYSYKENVVEGLWRVTVKVDDKRIVGRMKFYIRNSEAAQGKLITEKL